MVSRNDNRHRRTPERYLEHRVQLHLQLTDGQLALRLVLEHLQQWAPLVTLHVNL
jgi:hypothetical protein